MAWYNIFSKSDKLTDNILDKDNGLLTQVGSWVGKQQFTDEEQALYKMKVAEKAAEFVGSTLSENTERSKTRRSIAVMWIKVELFLILTTAVLIPIDKSLASEYFNLAASDIMLYGTGSIIVFFFGPYVWGAHINKSKQEGSK